jgi:hypothetical protein
MGDSNSSKPGFRPAGNAPAQAGTASSGPASTSQDTAPTDTASGKSGRVIHDERGNAVWDWVKDTTRIAIGSTSRLLKRLEAPELKIEGEKDELSIEADRDQGGGYNPYGAATPRKGGPGAGGGYDPYQKSVTRKPPGRK